MNSTDFLVLQRQFTLMEIIFLLFTFIYEWKKQFDFTCPVEPFYSLMKPSKLLHIRANLTVSKTKIFKTPFHTDYHEQTLNIEQQYFI